MAFDAAEWGGQRRPPIQGFHRFAGGVPVPPVMTLHYGQGLAHVERPVKLERCRIYSRGWSRHAQEKCCGPAGAGRGVARGDCGLAAIGSNAGLPIDKRVLEPGERPFNRFQICPVVSHAAPAHTDFF